MLLTTKNFTLLVTAALLAACGARGGPAVEEPAASPASGTAGPLGSAEQAVVVFAAYLYSEPGRGERLGEIQPDNVVGLGRVQDEWREIELTAPLQARGWVRSDRLGCRALREVELRPLEGRGGGATLRPGALLAVRGERHGRIEVATQDSVFREGTIERSACGIGATFVPGFPRGAVPHKLVRQATMVADGERGGQVIRLPEGYRFAVAAVEGRHAVGWTDGPVKVRGRIERSALERDRSTPLDRLAEPLGYTHEVLVEASMRDAPEGAPLVQLPGGTPANPVERRDEWVKIRTFGSIQLEGWVEGWAVRRVALDHNELEPLARRRIHVPFDRSSPRGIDPPSPNRQ